MRITKCDGPNCSTEWRTAAWNNEHPITVEADADDDHGQFCSWSCLASWATNRALEREGIR
jgi:hypothetical protein